MSDRIGVTIGSEDSDTPGVVKAMTESETHGSSKQAISLSSILIGIRAVGAALNLPEVQVVTILDRITTLRQGATQRLPLDEWLRTTILPEPDAVQGQVVGLAAHLAFLQECGRQSVSVSPADLDRVWLVIKCALQHPQLNWTMTRSAQGLLAIPLWSVVVEGRIEELLRVHIWLPDGIRADPSLAIHLHQPFAQSWILAGEGTDHVFEVTPSGAKDATHAEYLVGWKAKDDEASSEAYKVHSKSSTATNTGNLVRVVPAQTETHTRNMSYCVPVGAFHSSEVDPDALHATVFFFDSSRGYVPYAAVIGPISRATFTHERKAPALSIPDVANLIEDLRSWELFHEEGQQLSDDGQWEEALRAYRTALHVCNTQNWLKTPRYTHYTLGRIGHMYRMLGLYDQASESLEEAVLDTPLTKYRVYCLGELAVVYRHMNRLEDCKKASEDQYKTAKKLNLEKFACRAIGTLGMVNFQLFQLNQDRHFLISAINQLEERIETARHIGDVALEAIGYGRISLCYIAQESYQKAIDAAQKNFDLMQLQGDATKRGFASAFLGRTLLLAGRKDEALALFNPIYGCPPIVALCKEISDEHRQYIVEMIEAGADLKLRDDQGYTALECAVYNGDEATAKIIEQALRAQLAREGREVEQEVQQFRREATLRKGYRDVFQDRLRPVLLSAKGDSKSALNSLRKAYATSLAADPMKLITFDRLKYVTYSDFLSSNRLPRSNHGYTWDCTASSEVLKDPFIVFFSYRWIAKDPGARSSGDSPDDIAHTQYQRMLRAIKLFLERHPTVDREQLCIWLDFACVDQDHQQPGVAALPMNLAQCNAMISLVDDRYYQRSWCCVEVLMIQTLKKAYGIHLWYEHVIDPKQGTESLRTGPLDLEIHLSGKQVTYEVDRSKLLFLERQTRLLG